VPTARDVGSDVNRDSDVDPQTGRSAAVLLNEGLNPGLTIGLGHPGGRGTLPLANTALQPLRVGDRTTYSESDGGVAYGTDTVLPGGSSVNGSPTRRVRDRAGNLLFLSNDARGLRLHRALMLLPASGRQYSFNFNPPLVLLKGSVTVGNFTGTGALLVRRVDARAGRTPPFNLHYAATTGVAVPSGAGIAANVLPERDGPQAAVPYVDVERTLRFSGAVKGTPLTTATRSYEQYGVDLGLLSSVVSGGRPAASLTALRRGAQDDMDGDRRADVLALDNGSAQMNAAVVIPG
jgi:hypothetical protein